MSHGNGSLKTNMKSRFFFWYFVDLIIIPCNFHLCKGKILYMKVAEYCCLYARKVEKINVTLSFSFRLFGNPVS